MAQVYVRVVLPLPLYNTYTYSVSEEVYPEPHRIDVGTRVLVQFGRRKQYTAIVVGIDVTCREEYEVKPILAVLDPEPILRGTQLKIWKWMTEYYLCAPGEIFRAAVPTGLKPESETYVCLNPDYEETEDRRLNERQATVVMLLSTNKRMRLSELATALNISNATPVVTSLLELGAVEISENMVERYRPKKETIVSLTCGREEDDKLHGMFDLVTRSKAQQRVLMAYIDMSGWMQRDKGLDAVTRKDLLKRADVTPGVLRAMVDKGIFTIEKRSVNRFRGAEPEEFGEIRVAELSEAQSRALSEVRTSFDSHRVTLLHGVTGSGKTEIYTYLIKDALEAGKQVLYLVPEISLTTQLTDRLRRVFGERLLVYHSKFSDNERVDIWRRMLHTDEPLVILGVRSSVFLPFAKVGLVIVDEEHEASYKQYDPAPRYNARDVSVVLADMHDAPVVFGSATPSIETYYKARTGRFGLVELSERYRGAVLPRVEIVDMRRQRKEKLNRGIVSLPLRLATERALHSGKQAIMFQNRRGFAPVVVCRQCGWTPKCQNCDVSLVYHKQTDMLRCHYCGYARTLPKMCPACGENALEIYGYGTERIAEEMHRVFEPYRVVRMDLDTTRNKDSYQEIIEEFANHETDILVGTQMVSKGLDFEKVDVVGVINADTLLNFPDFRSNERAFNMLEQVAGRAGRRAEEGIVIIQTTKPDDNVLQKVKEHDYHGYYESELEERKQFWYPPFTRVINVYVKNKDAVAVDHAANLLAAELRNRFGNRVSGPEKPFVSRVATWYLQCIMLKVEATSSMAAVKRMLREVQETIAADPFVKSSIVYYDVDPV